MMPKLLFALPVFLAISPIAAQAETISNANGLAVSVEADGGYQLEAKAPAWRFAGRLPAAATKIEQDKGSDALGSFRRLAFRFSDGGQDVAGEIRIYASKNVALFSRTWPSEAKGAPAPFPDFTNLPAGLHPFSYRNQAFAGPAFGLEKTSTPWLLFDDQKNAFIISPASHFLCAKMVGDGQTRVASGFEDRLVGVPAHFTQQTLVAMGPGINRTWDAWGHAMTVRQGKKPIASDADPILKYFGYWTDNGAEYWYNYDLARGYQGTMEDVVSSLRADGVPIRYLQLDSWWYHKTTTRYDGQPEGPKNNRLPEGEWNRYGGTTLYQADTFVFPQGLPAFHKKVELPFITHNRWIDPTSPYHQHYRISGIAAVDPGFWKEIAAYLHTGGVVSYEQDWLISIVENSPELTSTVFQGDAFLDSMAGAFQDRGLTMQYCMAPASVFMQGSKYGNLTTIRVSDDKFIPDRYHSFLYTSRLAWSIGSYPWSDVFRSTEMSNLILAVLSAGPVGTGDAVGKHDKGNILQAVRADGVIVKPDGPVMPTDDAYVAEAGKKNLPTLATTYTDHDGLRTLYGVAVARDKDQQPDPLTVTLGELGCVSPVYVYRYLDGTGEKLDRGDSFTVSVKFGDSGFFTVAPIGPSGIAFLGDAGKIVGTGKQRIASLHDDGRKLTAGVLLAVGETEVKLHGYAPAAPKVSVVDGEAGAVAYDAATHHFSVVVKPTGAIATEAAGTDPTRKLKVTFTTSAS